MKTSTLVLVSCLTTGCTSITDQCIQEGYRPDAPGAGFSDCIVRKHAEQNARIAIPVTFDENPNEITLIKTGGVYEIPVELNEVLRINLIFDSGATEASIAPDVFLTLLRTGTIGGEDWLPGSYYQIADGSRVKSNRFRMKSIKIGNRIIKNVNCSISNSIKAPMLLGQSALEQLGEYTFNYKNNVLILK